MVFPKVTVYHSTLRERTAENPLRLMLTSLPRPSKFKDKPDYVTFQVEGDSTSYTYQCESPEIRDQLDKLPVREWLDVRAFGAKDAAVLEVEPVGVQTKSEGDHSFGPQGKKEGDHLFAPQGETNNRGTPDISQGERNSTGGGTISETSLARGYWEALDAAVLLVEAFTKRHGREPSEAERTIACSLWIEQNRSQGRRPLCAKEG